MDRKCKRCRNEAMKEYSLCRKCFGKRFKEPKEEKQKILEESK